MTIFCVSECAPQIPYLAHLAIFGRVIERTKNHRYRGLQLLAWHGQDMKLRLGVSPAWMQGFRLWGCNDVLNDFRFGDVSRPQEHDQDYCLSCIALVDALYTLPLYIALLFILYCASPCLDAQPPNWAPKGGDRDTFGRHCHDLRRGIAGEGGDGAGLLSLSYI